MSKTTHPSQPPAPATPAPAARAPRDAHTGQGGHYAWRDGQRVLVQRTQPRPQERK